MSEEKKCSQENPCQECKDKQKELLAKIEDWEVNRKEKIEKFEFTEAEYCNNRRTDGNKIQYSSFCHGKEYKNETCLSCQKVIKSNQIKSNQIKSNQIKSNQIKSNQAVRYQPK